MLKQFYVLITIGLLCNCSASKSSMVMKGDEHKETANGRVLAIKSKDRLTHHPVGSKYSEQGFVEYLPSKYDGISRHPLMIFFHGLGENGNGTKDDLEKLLIHGPAKHMAADEWPLHDGEDFIVLAPQNHRERCHEADDIDAFIDWAVQNYEIDENRIYLVGLSCGAIGIWDYLRKYSDKGLIAANVVICGDGRFALKEAGCAILTSPLWAIHGDADNVVPQEGSTEVITQLRECSKANDYEIKLTIYPDVNHDSWTKTFDMSAGHNIYSWLLTH